MDYRPTPRVGALIAAAAIACTGPVDAAEPARLQVVTLAEVERQALDANHDIRIARSAVDGARAGVLQADTAPNPILSWNGASLNPSGVGAGGVFGKRVDQIVRVDQTFERGGKRALRTTLANTQVEVRQFDLQEQRRETLQQVRDAYVDLLAAERRVEVFDETAKTYAAALDAATKRVKAGDLAAADLARFRVEVLRARTDGDAALGDRAHAQVALALLLGLETDPSSLATDGNWPSFDGEPIGPSADVDVRPDVASARLAVRAASTSIELARAQRVRDITIGAQFERYPGYGGTGNTVGAGLSIPLLFGNDYRGDVGRAAADHAAAETLAEKTRAAALLDTANARTDLSIAAKKVETYDGGLLEAAKSAADSADFAFKRGALGIMDLMDSRRTLLATRLDALAARADYVKAVAAVAAATTRAVPGEQR